MSNEEFHRDQSLTALRLSSLNICNAMQTVVEYADDTTCIQSVSTLW